MAVERERQSPAVHFKKIRKESSPEMKRSDQEIKQPSKQQEPICPVASKMQNGHMALK